MRISRAIILFAAVIATLSACSSGDGKSDNAAKSSSQAPAPSTAPSSSAAPTGGAGAKEPCALLPAEAVGKAISVQGVTSAPGPVQDHAANGGKAKSCVYSAGGKELGALAVTRFEGNKIKPAEMIAALKKAKAGAKDVAGVGEGAVYYATGENKTATLAAAELVDTVPVLVNYTGSAAMTQEMMTPLVKTAVDAN
ncbi:DUF3558 domain-containing protein [Amycolatopsis sp. BJA-103]|uniref:DUF3558 domain-containing protein n=1 Tax=unclassified Amycolatopsis TaxID=2618356 RepID=UPI000C78C0F8|nr:DUF3558 domain-containing protein [Amycolatopsis sp. BJA-103]AUI61884.1 DUF3558 domain-containing protein [Amycolatopsis sp. BJA-103]PNE20819.1 DUF3558 domain-containing protein [Amycolatopsis sp. BJA-103]